MPHHADSLVISLLCLVDLRRYEVDLRSAFVIVAQEIQGDGSHLCGLAVLPAPEVVHFSELSDVIVIDEPECCFELRLLKELQLERLSHDSL